MKNNFSRYTVDNPLNKAYDVGIINPRSMTYQAHWEEEKYSRKHTARDKSSSYYRKIHNKTKCPPIVTLDN